MMINLVLKPGKPLAVGPRVAFQYDGASVRHQQPGPDQEDAILADTPQAFSEAVVMLLRDTTLRRRYEQAAASLAAQFDWAAIGVELAQLLARVTALSVPPHPGTGDVTKDSMNPGTA